jgi:hypothetical protein
MAKNVEAHGSATENRYRLIFVAEPYQETLAADIGIV